VRPHASRTAVSPTAHTREKVDICRFYKPHDEAAATSPAGVAREWNTIGGILSGLGTRDSGPGVGRGTGDWDFVGEVRGSLRTPEPTPQAPVPSPQSLGSL
jgi:hypothetical protein